MAFGQDFLSGFFGNDYLRDYTHASKTFRSAGYQNSPRFKFLFHVYFNLNTSIPGLNNIFGANETSTLSVLVKSVDLPSFELDVETLNQYNRKRLVQKKISYQPITLKFHDDNGDLSRNLWYNYYAYYYKDPSQKYGNSPNTPGTAGNSPTISNAFSYNNRDQYNNDRSVNDWGYIGESYFDATNSENGKPAFFRDITIYGFNQHEWVSYVLINPLITSWKHDTYDYSASDGIMENTVSLAYEGVKYFGGGLGGVRPDTNVPGFADPANYDQQQSPLSRPGGTRSILGQGGLLDAGVGIIQDLQSGSVAGVLGAVQKAGTTYDTFKGQDLKAIVKEEGIGQIQNILRGTQQGTSTVIPVGGIRDSLNKPLFPTPSQKTP